jgi:hypothetical protein
MMLKTFSTAAMAALAAMTVNGATAASAVRPYEFPFAQVPAGLIDTLVFRQFDRLNIQPANNCSDAVFVRRAYLDVIGTLPTAFEAQEFIRDQTPNKRRLLIDRLLEKDEFADYWAMKWSDMLRIKAEFPINLWPNAAQAYHRWIHSCLQNNMPYDQVARALLTSSGSNFRVPPVNFYRAMQSKESTGIAQTVALVFLGERADKWPKDKLAGMAAFFSKVGYKSTGEWKEEIVYFNPQATNAATRAVFPDGMTVRLNPDRDPREVFADWLLDPQNPRFAKNTVNRIWCWLLGRGIVHEPDDLRPDNPPSNPELLDYLAAQFSDSHYDLKRVFRLILNSRTYQLSSVARNPTPEAVANFASYPLRRLDAEVLIDALNQITGTTENYSSPIPEPFTYIPESERSIALADGSITSPFLEMFGRPPRDTGFDSERNNRITADQELHLLNSTHILQKIEKSRMIQYQMQSARGPRAIANGLYLGILSRFPTEEEIRTVEAYAQSSGLRPRDATVDLAWALINSAEFLYRH